RLSRCTVSWCARGIRHLADSLTLANGFGCGPRISLLRTGGLRVPTAAGATVWGGRGTHHGIDVLHFPVDKRVEGSGKPRGEHERASDKRGAEHDSEDCHKQPDFMCCDVRKLRRPTAAAPLMLDPLVLCGISSPRFGSWSRGCFQQSGFPVRGRPCRPRGKAPDQRSWLLWDRESQ